MRNGFTHFLFGSIEAGNKRVLADVQVIKNVFQVKYLWSVVLLLSLGSLSFAQTNTEGATSAMTKAGAPVGSYSLSGFENVNLFNGNLNFNLPLVKVGGRGKAQSAINLAINSARWNVERDSGNSQNSDMRVKKDINLHFYHNDNIANLWNECTRRFIDDDNPAESDFAGYRECIEDAIELGDIIENFDLWKTGLFTAPGSYYSSYLITENTSLAPGYSPGVLFARQGKNFRTTLVRLFFKTSDGTEYELRDQNTDGQPQYHTTQGQTFSRGQVFLSPDGAGLRFVSSSAVVDNSAAFLEDAESEGVRISGTLYFPDGTRYEIDNGNVVTIKDVNGNQIIYTYQNNKVISIEDSLGRQVIITYNNPANDSNDQNLTYDEIKTQKSASQWQTVKIYRTKLEKTLRSDFPNTLPLSDLFPEFVQGIISGAYNPEGVVKRVELPDHKTYEFFYTPYNEIARVVLPTGGAFEYDFPMPVVPGSGAPSATIFRPIKQRRVYANGGTGNSYNGKQEYVRNMIGTYPNQDSVVTVEEHSGNVNYDETSQVFKSNHYFYGLANSINHQFYPKWSEGREYKTEIFEATPNHETYGQLRQRTETEWENPLQVAWANPQNPSSVAKHTRVKSTTATVFEGNKSLTGKTEYGYDNASLTNNKTDEYIYDYAAGTASTVGVPTVKLKHGKTYYLKVNPANNLDYTSDSIFLHGLPERSELYQVNSNNTETLVSKSEIKYDEGGNYQLLSDVTPSTGWTDPGNTPRGNPTTSIAYNLSAGTTVTTHAQFDRLGNARKAWDANGVMSEVQYNDKFGDQVNRSSYAFPTKTIAAAPGSSGDFGTTQTFETTTVYDFYTGLPLSVTNENDLTKADDNLTTTTEYNDILLRPTRVITPNGQQTIFEYGDQIGGLYSKVKTQIDATNWTEATAFADGLGRTYKTQTKDAAGDVFTETEFDNMGRVKRTTNPYRSGETKLWSETRYDALGRTVETFAPAATGRGDSTGVMSFDLATDNNFPFGTVVIGKDAAGRRSRSVTNALGQLIRVDEPTAMNGANADADLGSLTAPAQPTSYKYDALGKMIEVTQGNQHRYFLYDTLGRLLRVKQPEQEVNSALALSGHPTNSIGWSAGFTYDNSGNVLTATDAKGTTITNAYDNLNRVKTRSYSNEPSGQAATPTVYFTYDGVYYREDNYKMQAAGAAKGALTQVRNGISTAQTTAFDTLGKPLTYQQITDGTTYTSQYQYNFAGALIQETYPSGRTIKNEFNQDGDLLRISSKANAATTEKTYANGFAYTPSGAIEKLHLGNGLWEAAKFNNRLQITELGVGIGTDNLNKWKVNYEYGEIDDNNVLQTTKNTGNIAKQTIIFQGLTNPFVQTYKYDSLNRLKEAKEVSGMATQTNWTQTFNYDQYGNRNYFSQTIGTQQLVLNNQNFPQVDANTTTNRFADNQGYGYDKNGNITSDPTAGNRTFTFDGDNKQTEVKTASGVLIGKYFYDGEGRRVKKQTYDANGVVKETTVFVYSSGKLIAEYSTAAPPANPTTSYTTTDHLGSPRVITDAVGNVTSRRDFMPFGEDLPANIGGRTEAQKYSIAGVDSIRQKFTGYEQDTETNLDFAEARYYNNAHGRFTAVDPLLASGKSANPQSFNRYVYTGNNPILRTDPSGLDWYFRDGEYRYSSDNITFDRMNSFGTLLNPGKVDSSWIKIQFDANGEYRYPTEYVPGATRDVILTDSILWSYGEVKVYDQTAYDSYIEERDKNIQMRINMIQAVEDYHEMDNALRPLTTYTTGSLPQAPGNLGVVYDRMISAEDGSPEVGTTSKTLGTRVGEVKGVDGNGNLLPGTGGMSVSPSVEGIPAFKLKNTTLYCILCTDLRPNFRLGMEPGESNHLYIEPAYPMQSDTYNNFLHGTRQLWKPIENR